MSYLLDHFLVGSDPFGQGLCSDAQLGMGLWAMNGMHFPMLDGAVLLLRRRLYPDVGEWMCCGMAGPDATTISNGVGFSHAADEAFQYTTARALGNGYLSELAEPIRVDFDAQGDRITPALPLSLIHISEPTRPY